MQVIVAGAAELRAQLGALPDRLRGAVLDGTTRGADLEARAIRADTPHLSGALAGSIQVSVTRTSDGAQGRVYSDLRYTPYVESGTRQHGAGRHMFDRGRLAARGPAEDLYQAAVDEVAESVR